MDNLKLKTSIQFPFIKMTKLVAYNEVKKPSGLAYLLLVLIDEAVNKDVSLSSTLENYGIPKSLEDVCIKALGDLAREDVISVRGSRIVYSNEFSNYLISDIKFTTKGAKIFREKAIPTGVSKEIKVPIYYNIAKNDLSFELSKDLEARPNMDSALSNDFINTFKCKKDIEDFLKLNRGYKIPVLNNEKIGSGIIKKEEVIVKVEDIQEEAWLGKYDCDIIINGDSLEIEFEDKVFKNFIETYYNGDIISKMIAKKNKFKFTSSYTNNLKLSQFKDYKIVGVLTPQEMKEVLKQKGKALITKNNYQGSNYYIIENEEGLNKFNSACEFVVVDKADNKYGFIPGIFNFNNEVLNNISIPLVLKVSLTQDNLKEILFNSLNSFNNYSEDNLNSLIKISSIAKDYDTTEDIMSGYLGDNPESNIVLLKEMKQHTISDIKISEIHKKLLKINYLEYLKTITEDNIETVLKITKGIPEYLKISNREVISLIFDKLDNVKNVVKTYETLVLNGMDKRLVLSELNPVPDVLKDKDAKEKSLLDMINFDNQINILKESTKIIDYKNYTFDEDDMDVASFKPAFKTMHSLKNNIELFKSYNLDLFNDYDKFIEIFTEINDYLNKVEDAMSNPDAITVELVDKNIISGKYRLVFADLSVKLEHILNNKFNLKGILFEKINAANDINNDIKNELHKFRIVRNSHLHPENMRIHYDANDLRRWSEIIFDLEGENK